jgi:streptomycin 6-kinase
VRLKAVSEGAAGEAWLAGLAGAVLGLAAEWNLSIGRTLGGGTGALVVEATTADGRAAVLKLDRPERDPPAGELRTLLAARGRGYAEVYAHDALRGAILLERLGPQLAECGLGVDDQITVLCETLRGAWTMPPEGEHFTSGAEKAADLARFIEAAWLDTGRPLPERAISRALAFADSRRRAFDPRDAVLAHGDAHCWNALLVPGRGPPRFKFVDPDGLFIDRAYDLGISMREWTEDMLAGDPVVLGLHRCRRLASLTGVEARPIWEWGFVERVSTALLCLQVGLPGASEMLAIADAWADQPPP